MEKLYILFIVLLIQTNQQIKLNPIFIVESKNPVLLSTDDDYFYLLTNGKNFKIEKDSGNIVNYSNNSAAEDDYIFIADNSYNNYVYISKIFYHIIYNPFISYQIINIYENEEYNYFKIEGLISINNNNNIIAYGYYENDYLMFSTNFELFSKISVQGIINYKIICKFLEGESFVCGIILDSKFQLFCYKYHINSNVPSKNYLINYENPFINDNSTSFGLYDTDKNDIKLFCNKNNQNIICKFIQITLNGEDSSVSYELLGDNNLSFITSNNFTENNCYFLIFNNEYLFCCGITDHVKCFKININTYKMIKVFKILMNGDNSYLTIKNNNDFITLLLLNNYNNINSVYEYYIYLPTCQNKNYFIYNNRTNSDINEETTEKLTNLFIVKTNKYYFEIVNPPDEYGYFTLNNTIITQKALISNNDYIINFNWTNMEIKRNLSISVNYIVSVEDEGAYSEECQITLNYIPCYKSCQTCSKDINNSNETQHNCIKCLDNYYPSPENNNNCYLIVEKKINWYFDSNISEFGLCYEKCEHVIHQEIIQI